MDFSAVAHDLRTPLNVMLGHMQLLSVEHLSDTGRHRLCVLEAQVRRMMRLLDGCGADASAARRVRVDLAAVIRNAVSELDVVLERQRIDIRSNIEGDLPTLLGDGDLLHRVMLNVLMNAADSIAGGGRIEIDARVKQGSPRQVESIDVEITDTGAGIPADLLQRVFEHGFTTKRCGESHGLGLCICREIIELHGGDIQLSSEAGRGTTVRISFPLKS